MDKMNMPIKSIYGFRIVFNIIIMAIVSSVIVIVDLSILVKGIICVSLLVFLMKFSENKEFSRIRKEDEMQSIYKSSQYIKKMNIILEVTKIMLVSAWLLAVVLGESASGGMLIAPIFIILQGPTAMPLMGKEYGQTGDSYFKLSDILHAKKEIKKGYIYYKITLKGYVDIRMAVKEKYLTKEEESILDERLLVG